MLEVKNISKTFNPGTVNEKMALNGLSLTLEDGEFVTVIGGNGAGKSSLLNAISGVWMIDEGSIVLNGVDLTKMPDFKRSKYIGRVFQDPLAGTAPDMWIEENLALAYRRGQKRGLRRGIFSEEKEIYRDKLKDINLGLVDRMTSKIGLLSYGQ